MAHKVYTKGPVDHPQNNTSNRSTVSHAVVYLVCLLLFCLPVSVLVCVNISLCILASAFVEVHIVSCFIQLRRWQWTWEKHTLNYYSTQKSGLRWAIFVLKQFFNTLFWLNFNGRLQSNAKCTLLCWTDFLFSPIEDFDTMTMWYFTNSGTTRKKMPAGIPWATVRMSILSSCSKRTLVSFPLHNQTATTQSSIIHRKHFPSMEFLNQWTSRTLLKQNIIIQQLIKYKKIKPYMNTTYNFNVSILEESTAKQDLFSKLYLFSRALKS